MNPWLNFITRIQTAVGKTLLLAGIVPATVLLLGFPLYHQGWRGVEESILPFLFEKEEGQPSKQPIKARIDAATRAKTATKDPATALITRALMLLSVAAVFFILRGEILTFYRSLPIPGVRPLMEWCQRRAWHDRKRKLRLALDRMSLLKWQEEGFAVPSKLPVDELKWASQGLRLQLTTSTV
jgi:hypothetical protein